ncbi:MAG: Heat-inducible transcription repressor hrcA [uncultured bacterium]|uniref:Heat-inducible transcription repressor HrcA n=1 Tax=Candidatus Woesebacteria bacterium RIFCSPHIGHO2_12_FULL_41_24 TaxID=1802510 RepID=A0A1F8AVC1_9BACT|nr:MAG: Heat-inducible transcription repressor hrcA [uncultured bacterium]OGM14134.1 MAG: hypothetical protein A2W15_03640 [Candidatus Woesebacteria bacterium RBG_16_41_13]OGM29620.1 MAG: hypothetical protein A2873_03665 [Candidatus Woesebacteria bacterium RIFCSPHIGHO2_01_FULL_42_80]OGM35597.1 MAG: hypothetical protein A3D84_03490 [Candidatus Woesebacteria bacterium RIFCSPHIGHO2_02_FULL_42_20]OGM55208.1 MAG: hypothetical protein A3E44_02900 [Candidatus Woesebacteria bacterium RIFCSPHIGHO2_12_FU
MKDNLTARQLQLLKVIVDEYIESAEPVGSQVIEKKYSLGISSATIRNEMGELVDKGFLKQPHTSAGRVPTPKAMKFYISQLMEEKHLSLTDEVRAKEEVSSYKGNVDRIINEATHGLARRTGALAVSALDDGSTWHAGYASLFGNPGFSDMAVCRSVFGLIEESKRIHELFFERLESGSPVEVLFGEELGWRFFEPVGVVARQFTAGGKTGAIGVIGPLGFDYPYIIPTVRYFGDLIEELSLQ